MQPYGATSREADKEVGSIARLAIKGCCNQKMWFQAKNSRQWAESENSRWKAALAATLAFMTSHYPAPITPTGEIPPIPSEILWMPFSGSLACLPLPINA